MNSNATLDGVGEDSHHHPQSMFALPAPDCLLPDAPAEQLDIDHRFNVIKAGIDDCFGRRLSG
jgi:hypothetical protein